MMDDVTDLERALGMESVDSEITMDVKDSVCGMSGMIDTRPWSGDNGGDGHKKECECGRRDHAQGERATRHQRA